jgi:Family of unknown function (DUF5899)
MEIALPILALGGLYVISNSQSYDENKKKTIKKMTQENFTNMGAPRNYLPNTNTPSQNFPVTNSKELINTVEEYPNPNTATDKYFNQNFFEKQVNNGKKVGNEPQQIFSLTGNYLDGEQFKHNNMVPFVKGKIQGYTYTNEFAETILDNMVGNGSQTIKKVEQAPLFKPEDNVQYPYGAPNNSDFYQSRVNPGMISNNVKPFETINVGPGLNQGYSTAGSNGFNSGMEARDLWLPKTVDELRVNTNPKLEYTLNNLEGPANSQIKNLGIIGRVEKQKPDTFFFNTQDRWLTTTGAEKGETLRPIQEMGLVKRNNNLSNYKGPAGSIESQAGVAPTEYEMSKRNVLKSKDIPHCSAKGKGPINDIENLHKSHTNYKNHRSTMNQPETLRSGFGGAIGAAIAPLMDILKPSRKEETVNSCRVYGEASSNVSKSYVINNNDITNTTVKETTLYSPNFYINNQKESIYVNNYLPTELTQRDTTNCETIGNVGGLSTQNGPMVYSAAYNQHNNDIKSQTIDNRPNQGGTQVFNQSMNVSIARQDSDRYNNRLFTPSSVIKQPPTKENYGSIKTPQSYDQNKIGCDRIQGDLLQAFKNNPYTHSLTDSV